MRYFAFISIFFWVELSSCNNRTDNNLILQNQIDTLNQKLAGVYTPGLGEFMTEIQIHHAKLWFAGKDQNWSLAEFETGEIKETLTAIGKYCKDRPEIKLIGMINQPMDGITESIEQKNFKEFGKNFILLTATCNSCHQATGHEYNIIEIPDKPPFSNQDFKVPETK